MQLQQKFRRLEVFTLNENVGACTAIVQVGFSNIQTICKCLSLVEGVNLQHDKSA